MQMQWWQSYHSCFFVQVYSNRSDTVGQHRYEEDKNLDNGDPVGKVGPVITGVPAQLSFPVGLGRTAGHPALPTSHDP